MLIRTRGRTRRARMAAVLVTTAVAFLGAGCDLDPLDVPTDVVTPEAAADAAGAEALRLAAWNRFGQALTGTAGGATGLIPVSGLLADEFIVTSARAGLEAIDRRIVDDVNEETYATAQFQRLSQTRLFTSVAIDALENYAPHRQAAIAQMFTARAFSEILLAEHFCSGITLSEVVDGRPLHGEPLTTAEVFTRALAHADSALAAVSGTEPISHLARMARARALLNLGRFDDAAAAATAVPDDFSYEMEFSATASALGNGVTTWINQARIYSVADSKGGNGLPYVSAPDPRVVVTMAGLGQDGQHEAWVPLKYASAAAPVVIAGAIEARLIEAEARLNADDAPGALGILNELRTRVAGLDPLEDAGSPAARVDQLFTERAFWMFATAHRLGDLRRLVRQYGRDQADVFPVGEYFKGGNFGSEVTLPLPRSEANNPNFVGCIDRNA